MNTLKTCPRPSAFVLTSMAAASVQLRRSGALLLRRTTLCWVVSSVGLLSACGETPARRTEAPDTTQEASAGAVDWNRRAISLESPSWSLEFCEGEGPFLCVARGSGQVGSVELFRIPVSDHALIAEALGRGRSEFEALGAAAAEFVAVLSADRRSGLEESYRLRGDPPTEATVMGQPGLRLVVEGHLAGRVRERIVHYYAIHRDTLYLLAATGTDSGGMLGEFTVDDLKAFEPLFGEIAAASRVDPIAR